MALWASRSDSTKTTELAPRDRASRPIAPEPAKRSSTAMSSTGPIRLNAASRTRSPVGRVSPLRAKIRAPFRLPAMIRTNQAARDRPSRPRERAHRERDGEVEPDKLLVGHEIGRDRSQAGYEADHDGPERAEFPGGREHARSDRDDHCGREVDQQDRTDDQAEHDRRQPVARGHQACTSWPANTRSTS